MCGAAVEELVTWLDFDVRQSFETSPLPLLSLWNRPAKQNINQAGHEAKAHPGLHLICRVLLMNVLDDG